MREGWWRDLAELPLDDERRVLSFLRRRGDPFGVLAPDGKQISTYDWRDLKAVLERAAVAWDPQPDATGVSHFRPEKLRSAEHMFDRCRRCRDGWANELERALFRHLPGLYRAKTLAAYSVRRCRRFGARGLDMRRCDYCSRGSPSTTPTPAGARAHAVPPAPTKGGHPMPSFRKIRTRKGAIRWQSRWRVPGANGRLQDRARELRDPEGSGEHAAQMREVERRGVGDPHRHDLAGYLRAWLSASPRARRPRADHDAGLRAQRRLGGAILRPCLARETQRLATSTRSMPNC